MPIGCVCFGAIKPHLTNSPRLPRGPRRSKSYERRLCQTSRPEKQEHTLSRAAVQRRGAAMEDAFRAGERCRPTFTLAYAGGAKSAPMTSLRPDSDKEPNMVQGRPGQAVMLLQLTRPVMQLARTSPSYTRLERPRDHRTLHPGSSRNRPAALLYSTGAT